MPQPPNLSTLNNRNNTWRGALKDPKRQKKCSCLVILGHTLDSWSSLPPFISAALSQKAPQNFHSFYIMYYLGTSSIFFSHSRTTIPYLLFVWLESLDCFPFPTPTHCHASHFIYSKILDTLSELNSVKEKPGKIRKQTYASSSPSPSIALPPTLG